MKKLTPARLYLPKRYILAFRVIMLLVYGPHFYEAYGVIISGVALIAEI
ncbi:hypothetical protein [Shewanella surugensis]|uniref:Uncharacterized protein n=1 Tax=Shewanella surugensis TaxID=212020 RepID=A0ABT0L721_9GAMM|nr:hypothetical protein [Shewanella surugensis]MCL1123487.1 hypothetical protein [Shewanella surugensis]